MGFIVNNHLAMFLYSLVLVWERDNHVSRPHEIYVLMLTASLVTRKYVSMIVHVCIHYTSSRANLGPGISVCLDLVCLSQLKPETGTALN